MNYGLKEVYAGYVSMDSSTGEYVKTILNNDRITLKHISDKKNENRLQNYEVLKENESKRKRKRIIEAISRKLQDLPDEELLNICDSLNISENDLNLKNTGR